MTKPCQASGPTTDARARARPEHPGASALAFALLAFAGLTSHLSRATAAEAETVIVLTPHVDAIRSEFGAGFARWHEQQFGAPAKVEWRNVGGTSDALRFVRSEFQT